MTEPRDRLPEGCECRLDFYLTSDSNGMEIKVGIGGLPIIPSFKDQAPDALKLIASLGAAVEPLANLAQDWRFMTRAEIADYKSREEEDA
ncbi:hypothetical protein ACLBYG_08095 [Methylobacterium sp. D53M]